MSDDYKRMLQKARKDLQTALEQRMEIDARIAALRQAITGLSALSGEPEEEVDLVDSIMETAGISNGVRRVLSASSVPMSAPEIRDALAKKQEYKSKLESYENPLSVIHNTLARLMRQGEVVSKPEGFALKGKS